MEETTPVERFLTFMPIQGHKAYKLFDGLTKFLTTNDINLENCRGQSYDNASAMSGKYNSLPAKVAGKNKLAKWIPCAGHSLNLVVKSAAECCPAYVAFFDFPEKIYVFFTGFVYRYQILTETKSFDRSILVPKRVTTTRWSCRADACKALERRYSSFKDSLLKIGNDENEIPRICCEPNSLYDQMCQLEIGSYAVFWNDILDRVNAASQTLQNPKLDLNTAVDVLTSLKSFVKKKKKRNYFDDYEAKGAEISGTASYKQTRYRPRNLRLRSLHYEQGQEAELSPLQKFRVENFLSVIDKFVLSLQQRQAAYSRVCSLFVFCMIWIL